MPPPPPTATSPPPPAAAPPARNSPGAHRKAKGLPTPQPLDLFKPSTLQFDSPPHTLEELPMQHHDDETEEEGEGSPSTPDRGLGGRSRRAGGESAGGSGSARKEERLGSGTGLSSSSGARSAGWSGQPLPPRIPPPPHQYATTSSHRVPSSSSSARLPPSASSASLGGRSSTTRRAPSVLGYTSSSRRNGSPARRYDGAASNGSPVQQGSSSRFLLTIVPPKHLPHDPPHPRTNPACSGYGPPEHFRRGTLIPLYPTLSSQLAAIAREYGLPSSGGLMLYLLSTTDPYTQGPLPGAAGFSGEGGPRISEAAWNLLWSQLFAEEEEHEMRMMQEDEDDATEDDEDYVPPPPVPPIPLSHSALGGGGRRAVSGEEGVLSDDNERHSSDAGASGSSAYSNGGLLSHGGSVPRQNPQQHRAVAQAGIGRGPPPSSASVSSPNTAKRFTSLPTSASHSSHRRHASRASMRSVSQAQHRPATRSSYAYAPPMSSAGRSTSYGSYAPSFSTPAPSYGASVVVGKIEFDIHSTARGGKWYEAWLEGANPSTSSSSAAAVSPAQRTPATAASSEAWQELHLPAIVASKTPQLAHGMGFGSVEVDEDFTPNGSLSRSVVERSAGRQPPIAFQDDTDDEPSSLSFHHAQDDSRLRTESGGHGDVGLPSGLSSFSLAALADHVPDEPQASQQRERAERAAAIAEEEEARTAAAEQEEQEQPQEEEEEGHEEAETSIVDKAISKTHSRSSSSLPSRALSTASSFDAASEKGTDDTPFMEQGEHQEEREVVEQAYQPLSDGGGEEDEPSKASYEPLDDGSDDGSVYGEEEPAVLRNEASSRISDPLDDVFGSDEATWQSVANDDSVPRIEERDLVETTGLGILGARVADLQSTAPEGVVERLPEQESLDERGLPPPQDDVAEVAALLGSSTISQQQQQSQGPLASPIRLSSSFETAQNSGVFPPSPVQGVDGHDSPSASPFAKSHSGHNSISTVQFSVRPPSTVASMSPEFLPQRKQRQGWTTVPSVVDPSMSASSSMSSISGLGDARRASTIGLENNLDELERALAELSPRAAAQARGMPRSPETIFEESSPLLEQEETFQPHPPSAVTVAPSLPPRTSSASSTSSHPAPALNNRAPFRYGMLSPTLESAAASDFGLAQTAEDVVETAPSSAGLTAEVPGYERDSPREAEASASSPLVDAAVAEQEPVEELEEVTVARSPSDPVRIPRTSSLNKSESSHDSHSTASQHQHLQQPPQLVALPLSPTPDAASPADADDSGFVSFSPLPSSSPPAFTEDLPPPRPAKDDQDDLPLAPPLPPRSPGLKNLRTGKWGSRGKQIDTAKALSPDSSADDGGKSPLGAFFGKMAGGKGKGFFRRTSDSSAPDTSAVEPSASTVVSDSFPPRKQSLDIGGSTGRQRRPSVSSGSQPPFANQSHPDFPASLASNAAAVSTSPRPPFLTESSNAAESYQTAQTTISPSLTPSPSALSSSLPSPSVDSILSPPQPTFYDRQQATGSPDFLLASPRSDYLPSTPKAGDSSTFAPSSSQSQQYPASAPTTPADWRTTPGGRPRVRGAKQQRLSADLDSLLGQFNEIDFGTDGDEVEKLAEKESGTLKIPTTTRLNPLVPEFSPRIVEPEPDVQEAYGGAAPLSPPLGKESAPLYSSTSTRDAPADFANDVSSRLLGVSPPLATAGRGQFALSADLSALGGLMTGLVASPPMSPETTSPSLYSDLNYPPPPPPAAVSTQPAATTVV